MEEGSHLDSHAIKNEIKPRKNDRHPLNLFCWVLCLVLIWRPIFTPSSDQLRQLTATDPKRGHADRALDAYLHEVRLNRKCWRFQ